MIYKCRVLGHAYADQRRVKGLSMHHIRTFSSPQQIDFREQNLLQTASVGTNLAQLTSDQCPYTQRGHGKRLHSFSATSLPSPTHRWSGTTLLWSSTQTTLLRETPLDPHDCEH